MKYAWGLQNTANKMCFTVLEAMWCIHQQVFLNSWLFYLYSCRLPGANTIKTVSVLARYLRRIILMNMEVVCLLKSYRLSWISHMLALYMMIFEVTCKITKLNIPMQHQCSFYAIVLHRTKTVNVHDEDALSVITAYSWQFMVFVPVSAALATHHLTDVVPIYWVSS